MTDFIKFREAVNAQIGKMEKEDAGLLLTNADKKDIWALYLESFPEGTDNLFITNTEHNCNCCKDFIRDLGSVVTINSENEIVTCWDINIDDEVYQTVANALSKYVKSRTIESVYKSSSLSLHVKDNKGMKGDALLTFDHFYYKLQSKYTAIVGRGEDMGNSRKDYNLLLRGLKEITVDALDTVLMLIDDNNLYLGEQNRRCVADFRALKVAYDKLSAKQKVNFVWRNISNHQSVVTIRNSAIGTLLINLSEGLMSVDGAVASYESIVAPGNYKRSKTVVTKKMIEAAQSTVKKLGFENSLQRRHASLADITINNVLWADANTSAKLVNNDVFDDMIAAAPSNTVPKNSMTIGLLDFVNDVVPVAKSIEVYLENKHSNNLMSLVAPVHADAPNMLKWNNNFTWSYNGNLTDSVKQRVKEKGGNVDGDVRVSLSWFNKDDLDIHMSVPRGNKIYYGNKSSCGMTLDVDMNVAASDAIVNAVENISCTNRKNLTEGEYTVIVNNYTLRNTDDVGFEIELEYLGDVSTFTSSISPSRSGSIDCFTFKYTHAKGIEVLRNNLNSSTTSKELWSLSTNNFHNVSSIMWSPNHWDDNNSGNRHVFFMLNNCQNPDPVRGFYNEYLTDALHKDRKVFEVLAGKMKAEPTNDQLSGLGFSTTKRGDTFTALVKTTTGNKLFNVVL